MQPKDLYIRKYAPEDRETVLNIGADTAFFGAPIERYMEDRHIFMDGFYACYLDDEPEMCWVACQGQCVVGFLTGCKNSAAHNRIMQKKILPAVMKKWLRGGYHPGRKTLRYITAGTLAVLRREVPAVDEQAYPAHLHINLLPDSRGYGLGRKLLEQYLNQLRQMGIPGVHLHTTSLNVTACILYENVGFRLLDARRTQMYAYLLHQPVENRCYGQRL